LDAPLDRATRKITVMLRNYFKIAFRNIRRHKAYSFINISGLAIGMASSILILLWVQNELSYDRFHEHAGEIYRITSNAGDFKTSVSTAGMPQGFQSAMPMIRNTVRLSKPTNMIFAIGDHRFEESHVFFADSTFLSIFTFPLVKGNLQTALQRPDAIVITEDMAKKYFGSDNPIGKIIRKDNSDNLVVTGVMANIPSNSHLQFDFIIPMSFLAHNNEMTESLWGNFNFYDYVQLDKNFKASVPALKGLEHQMDQIFKQHEKDIDIDLHLQPLTRIHLYSNLQLDLPGQGNILYVSIFFVVAIIILIVACINFTNLATARSARRAKEVGLRKVVGAVRGQLIRQFFGESLLISFFSLLVALLVVWMVLPSFNELAGKRLHIDMGNGRLLLTLLGISVVTGLISGIYPALFLSGFQPVKVLKGNLKTRGGNRLFRDGLVVIQFIVSIVLLVGTVVTYNQLRFIKDRNPGFAKDNLLYMKMKGDMWNKQPALFAELSKNPLTSHFTVTSEMPTSLVSGTIDVMWPGKDPKFQPVFPSMDVSESFIDIFQIKLLSGRGFSKEFKGDTTNFVINETAARTMRMTARNAVGQQISFQGTKGTIIGVVGDFNFKPIQRTIEPLVLRLNKYGGIVVLRTSAGNTEATIKDLAKISQELNPAFPFAYNFLDQDLANQYKGEQQMSNIFTLFAVLAVLISSLGLYGLSAYMAEQRTREIGVRKVLGASLFNILRLLSTDFTRLILIAVVIAIPLAWWAVNKWLETFAYHVHVSWPVFTMAPVAALLIAWVTVSYESLKAAVINPVTSLRSE
jgi:putative ABC transport system permease protein